MKLWNTADVVAWLKQCASESNALTCVSLSKDYSELFERCGFDGNHLIKLLEWDEDKFANMWEEFGDGSKEPLAMSHRISAVKCWQHFLSLSPKHKSVVCGLTESQMAVYQLLSPDAWGAFLASPDVEMLERALREEDEVTDGA